MYWRYAVRRILMGVLIYVVIIFIYSALFNTVMDQTLNSQIVEQVNGEMMKMSQVGTDPQYLLEYRQRRISELRQLYHLDDPVLSRIFWRAIDTLTFNYGNSTVMRSFEGETDVLKIVLERIPNTLMLFTTAIIIDILIGVWLGIKKAQKAGRTMDKTTSIITMGVYGLPSWWFGMVMIMLFAFAIPIFPSGGMNSVPPPTTFFGRLFDTLYHMALPVITLVFIGFWGRAYLTRNIVLGNLQEDFIMSARARGIPERTVLYGHALRTSAPPILTMSLLSLLASFSGALVFEGIFSWPGMGNLYWSAVQMNDIPVLLGNLSITTLIYISGIVVLDLIYGFLDPRIKVGGKA
ncbi:peptide ABC transporter permease [Petrotoga sp. 9T1HF07.CasAA.8.2]|uniref:ABC transporter permease n=1 Tax=unclassified Petrotoga TaxID=2620614 RepID=UPI000CC927BD|nr:MULTISPECIES: ABC transporter permease [unclassified Petrotoga]MBL5981370.1 peptide ABC transporter permease [Petrotoga sp. 8T1HF07.NaAc.6.1]PNR90011.1 peptide ABC transporter permease [Petrotoga sp. 9T1HF07.CasAA.8.2]